MNGPNVNNPAPINKEQNTPAKQLAPALPAVAPPNTLLYLAITRTPTHVGCGQGLGEIDLPLQRGKVSRLPEWPGAGIKGALRDQAPVCWGLDPEHHTALFGPERDSAALHAGMLMPQDARLLVLPVASLCGGWAWVTSREALMALRREAALAQLSNLPALPPAFGTQAIATCRAYACSNSPLQMPNQDLLVLGEVHLDLRPDATAQALCAHWGDWLAKRLYTGEHAADYQDLAAKRLVVVDAETFTHLATTATEVRARVSLGEGKVAADNMLWREECLPADTVMWGLVVAQPVTNSLGLDETKALALVKPCTLQLGGKATVGYGWVDLRPQLPSKPANTNGKPS